MFGKLLKFELSLQIRQISFWVISFLVFLFGIVIMSADWASISVEGGARIKNNGANAIAGQINVLATLPPMFFACVFVVTGMMRDDLNKFTEIIHATPVRNSDLVLPRMAGAILATMFCLIVAILGLIIGQLMPWIDKETLGPIRPLHYLYPILIFLIPNTLFITGFYAVIAGLFRNRMLVYICAIGLLAISIAAGLTVANAPKPFAALIDPFGGNPFTLETQYWPADEQNNRMLPLTGWIGANRLLWGVVAIFMFAFSYRLSKRGLVGRKVKKLIDEAEIEKSLSPVFVKPKFGFVSGLKAIFARSKFEYIVTIRSIAFYVLCGIALFLIGTTVLLEGMFSPNPTLSTSMKMARISVNVFGLTMLLMLVFFSGEIMWRDRTAKIYEIIDSGPSKNFQLLISKWIGLCLMLVTIVGLALLVGLILQLVMGVNQVNLVTYIQVGFVSFIPRMLILAALAIFIQNFIPHRVAGMFATALVLGVIFWGLGRLPFYHPLMNFGSMSPGGLSELNGFNNTTNMAWFGLFNLFLVCFLLGISVWLWRRGSQISLIRRIGEFRSRISLMSGGMVLASLIGALITGNIIDSKLDDANYRNTKQTEEWTVAYEKLMWEHREKPVPTITDVSVDVQFFPSRQEALVEGKYQIINQTDAPIKEFYLNVPTRHVEDVIRLEIDGGEVLPDNGIWKYTVRQIALDAALAPGQTSEIRFENFFHAPRLGDPGRILKNGTFVDNWAVMPRLGVPPNWLSNPDKRRKYGLEKLPKRADQTDMKARELNFFGRSAHFVDFDARVCTDPGQIPIAPGNLVSEGEVEVNGDMRYCRNYKSSRPILNFFAFMSGRLKTDNDVWTDPNGKDIPLTVYHHSTHDYNVPLIQEALKQSLDTFTRLYGPYQYDYVRVIEFPYRSFAQAFAGTIPFSENMGFVLEPGDKDDFKSVDYASYVTMHEIGHQWFAHQIVPANTKGFNILSEGLTEHAAYTAYEEAFGWKKARQLLEKNSISQYLLQRTSDRDEEPALQDTEFKQYLHYNKSAWVFWGLKHYMGEDSLNLALRKFVQDYGSKGAPYPTTFEMLDYIRAEAPTDYHQLIADYWERITFWDLAIRDAQISGDAGRYTVTLTAKVDKKIATEETGKETSVTEIDGEDLNEWVEIGFYDQNPKESLGGDWINLERIRVTELESELSFEMGEKPTHVLIDPRRLLIERNVEDNVRSISVETPNEG